jgi:hypothetical protein
VKFDQVTPCHINKTKTLKVITLGSFHCNFLNISIYRHRIDEDTEEEPKLPFFIDLFGYQVENKLSFTKSLGSKSS